MAQEHDFTTLKALWRDYSAMPRRLAFRAQSYIEWVAWRSALQNRLTALLGGFPTEPTSLDAHVLDVQEFADYRQEKVAFHSANGVYVPCYVLIPTSAPPFRPVIALHGHGSGGAAHVVGLTRDAATETEEKEHIRLHNYDYGRQLVQRGFMVFAPEQRGLGERMEPHAGMIFGDSMWRSSCRGVAFNALLLPPPPWRKRMVSFTGLPL